MKITKAVAASAVIGGGIWFGLKDSRFTAVGALASLAFGYLVQK